MYRTVLLFVLCCFHTLSHPVTESPSRHQRQVGECCPCPAPGTPGDVSAEAVGGGSQRGAGGLDDCPCRPRSSDSEGAASLLLPTAVRTDRPFLRSSGPDIKEDTKNLLKPEVALATSMLDTLREATEEEYQDALARDAEKSVAEPNDAVQEESARNLVIIVNPKDSDSDDDFVADASYVPESRCIHPLGSALGRLRSSQSNAIPDTLTFPKVTRPGLLPRNALNSDSSVGASNIEERIIDTKGNSPRFLNKPLLSSIPMKSTQKSLIDAANVEKLKFPLIPPLRLDFFKKSAEDKMRKNDFNTASSNNKQYLSESPNDKIRNLFSDSNSPLSLKNLLKLRDVDNIVPNHGQNKLLNELLKPSVLRIKSNDINLKESLDSANYKLENFEEIPTSRSSVGNENKNEIDECEVKQQDEQENKDSMQSPSQVRNSEIKNIEEAQNSSVRLVEPPTGDEPICNSSESTELTIDQSQLKNDAQNFENNDSLSNDDITVQSDSDTSGSTIDNILAISPSVLHEKTVDDPLIKNQDVIETSSKDFCDTEETSRDAEVTKSVKPTDTAENVVSDLEAMPSLSKTLESMRESLVNGLEDVRKSSSNLKWLPISENDKEPIFKNSKTNDWTSLKEAEPKLNSISMNDLQGMSDKLLFSESNRQSNVDTTDCLKIDDIEKSASTRNDNNGLTKNRIDSQERKNACPDNFKRTNTHQQTKMASNNTKNNEMDTAASENVISMLPNALDPFNSNSRLRTPFDSDTRLSLNDPLKLLEKPLLRDSLNLNTDFLSLDKFRERLANIFQDRSHTEISPMKKIQDIEIMTPEASITNSRRKWPSLKSLDDINVDVLKNKPFTSMDSLLKVPKLDLNSYRTKVPVPNNLELTSLAPRSKGTKESGIFDIVSERKPGARKSKPSIETLPSLEKIRNQIRSNTKNLLERPVHPDLDIFRDNFRSNNIDDIADTFRQNTQKTMKGLQQKMKTTIRKPKTINAFGDRYAKPQELLDDVDDKLKAIHYDLNDRLSSIRENILESSKLKALLDEPRKLTYKNVMSDLRPNKARKHPVRLQTSASTISTHETDPDESLEDLNTRASNNNFWQIPHGKQSEVDAPAKTIETNPKIRNLSLPYFQRAPSLRHETTIPAISKDRSIPTLPKPFTKERLENLKTVSPIQEYRKPNKVIISFGTTTPRPISVPRSNNILSTIRYSKDKPSNFLTSMPLRERSVDEKHSPAGDYQVLPSEYNYRRTTVPMMLSDEDDYDNVEDNLPFSQSFMKNSNVPSALYKGLPILKAQNSNAEPKSTKDFEISEETLSDKFSGKASAKALQGSQANENSFLWKLRDSVSNMLSVDSKNNGDNVNLDSKPNSDMLRSASRDVNLVGAEPLKENVSYRCRMVCTKELT